MSKRPSRKPFKSGNKKTRLKTSSHRRTQKRLIQSPFEQSHDAIALIDDQGCFVDVNLAASQLFGLPRQTLIGKALSTVLEADAKSSHPCFSGAFPVQQPRVGELSLSGAQAIRLKVEYTLTPKVLPNCHLLMLRDVSQRRGLMEKELRQQRQGIELFSEVTLKIRQSLQLPEILYTTVTEVQRILKADRVLIYQVHADGAGKAISEAVSPNYPAVLNTEFPEEVLPEDYRQLYAQGRVRAIFDVHDPAAGVADCLIEFVDQFDIKAKLIVPIVHNLTPHSQSPSPGQNQLWGLLIAHQCRSPRQWIDFELELMQQLADQISIALAQAQLLEHQEELVEARTLELKEVNRSLHQEINDRMQAEAALRQSEEQLRLITHSLPVLIAYVDEQQRYRFNNKAYEDWLGKSSSEIYGSHLKKIWGEECYQRMQSYVEVALSGQAVSYENDILLADGSVRTVDVTYIPDIEEDIEAPTWVKGFFALTSDISDHKEIERMKDEFISVVSHELRTPLTSLHSALKILATGKLGSLSNEGQQMLTIANDSTERLVRLVNNVLDLQRIESGQVILDRQACNVAHLMVQAVEAMQAMAQQHGVILETSTKDISVWADADYILQALTNLLSNAIKFSSAGGTVWLTVEGNAPAELNRPLTQNPGACKKPTKRPIPLHGVQAVKRAGEVGQRETHPFSTDVVFKVRDEGQGIPADQLKRIFERFQQVDSSDSRKKGGTGLGLTICRKIIEQHNGEIWAESTPGCGSTFCFTLPALKK